MKETHFRYGIAILAVVGITVAFVGYATDTFNKERNHDANECR